MFADLTVWNPTGPTNAGLRDQLETVQRKAARFVNNDWSWVSSPTSKIKELGWISTELVRKINNLMMFHKIVNNKIAIPTSILPKCSRDGLRFQQTLGRVLAYSNSFIPTVTKWWNKLPSNIIGIANEDQFKSKLTEHLIKSN